jgi:REP element-mobilizing transposase RayT
MHSCRSLSAQAWTVRGDGRLTNVDGDSRHLTGQRRGKQGTRFAGSGAMYHHTARMLPKFSLRDHEDASALWTAVTSAFPELIALCLMPNHVHLLLKHKDEARRLPRALSGWARWRNHRLGTEGGWWQKLVTPERVSDADKISRMIRYIHLNPCRANLVTDPLAWPWSTHRDRCGLAAPSVVARDRHPVRFHRYVSSDPSVCVDGSDLPRAQFSETRWEIVRDTVCSITRSKPGALLVRGEARRLVVQTAWICGVRDRGLMAAATLLVTAWGSTRRGRHSKAGVPSFRDDAALSGRGHSSPHGSREAVIRGGLGRPGPLAASGLSSPEPVVLGRRRCGGWSSLGSMIRCVPWAFS